MPFYFSCILDFFNYRGTILCKNRERFLVVDILHKYKIKTKYPEKEREEDFKNLLNPEENL